MTLDLIDVAIDLNHFKPHEIEELLEDPFAIRLLPDSDRNDGETRYYLIGMTLASRGLFLSFRSDGKVTRPIALREMTEQEKRFYDRKNAEII